jgi:hypothetical protein
MARYGWSYLTVTHGPDQTAASASEIWRTSDGAAFASENEMFRELGLTGWELVAVREADADVIYYFKRSRA